MGASHGDVFDIEVVKNTGGFNDWISAKKSDGNAPAVVSGGTSATASVNKGGYTPSPKSSYPTDEERAKTQVYIVRQSNITAAIATLSLGAKKLEVADVIKTAKLYEDHVFGNSNDSVASAVPFDAATAFDDLDDMPQ